LAQMAIKRSLPPTLLDEQSFIKSAGYSQMLDSVA
jgi:hypothetical protein